MFCPLKTLAATIALVGVVSRAAFSNDSSNETQITWGPCDPNVVNDTSLSCGFLNVPLDYHNSSAGEARLAVIKANATEERRGTVFMNPGGPNASGLVGLVVLKELLFSITGGFYDIISWDPRGVGLTIPGPINCFNDTDEYNALFNGTVQDLGIEEVNNFANASDVAALLAQAPILQEKYEEVGKRCLASSSGKYLRYVGSAAAARDMASIADVLGDGPDTPINYVGLSYGTLIGSWFVNMFPERVGRVILDAVLAPLPFATQEIATHWAPQLVSTDAIWQGIVTGCALAGPAGCAVAEEGDTAADIDAKFQTLLQAAHGAEGNYSQVALTSGQIRNDLYCTMYLPSLWSTFTNVSWPEAISVINGESQANASTATVVLPDCPTLDSMANTSVSQSQLAIYCGDSVDSNGTSVADVFEAVIAQTQNVAHAVGSMWPSMGSQCSSWPVRAVERYQGPFNKTLANTILLASNKYDPITPLPGAQLVTRLLGDHAVLLQVNGFGHSTNANPSSCVIDTFLAYMVNGTLPANNTICEVDDVEVFPGVTTADILANMTLTSA